MIVAKVNNIDTSGLVLKNKYDTDKSDLEKVISDTDKKYLTLVDLLKKQPFIKMLKFDLKINQKELVDKSDIANLVKNPELDLKKYQH